MNLLKINLVVLLAIAVFPLTLFAQGDSDTPDPELQSEFEALKSLGKRGAGIFAISMPGETFNELGGAVGHSAVDLSISGNGLLGFAVRRDFEDIASQYPYEFGSMSLRVPHLRFESESTTLPALMTCSQWQSEGAEVFHDIQFSHESGSVSLLHRDFVNPQLSALYPTSAMYISANNWYLDCQNDLYRVYSPDGSVYLFNAGTGAEQTENTRREDSISSVAASKTYPYKAYKINVQSKQRMNASLSFIYDLWPEVSDSDRNHRARPPLHHSSVVNFSTGNIKNKRRLTRVELRVDNEASATGVKENQFIYFDYNPNSGNCPGLLKSVRSTTSKVSEVRYQYAVVPGTGNHIGASQSRCLLQQVNNVGFHNSLITSWRFEYGFKTGDHYARSTYGSIRHARLRWEDYYNANYYLPLKSVVSPTGLKVSYDYRSLRTCEYANSPNADNNWTVYCDGDNPVRPALQKRTITGSDVLSQVTNVTYSRDDQKYQFTVNIENEETTHRLVFGRKNYTRHTTAQPPAAYFESGQLVHYNVLDNANINGTPLVAIRNIYNEGFKFPVMHSSRPRYQKPASNATSGWTGWAWKNNRLLYMMDNRRINMYRTITTVDGIEYETRYNTYDVFNNPTSIAQIRRMGGQSIQRNIAQLYQNNVNPAANATYFVGFLANKQTASGEPQPLVEAYVYNQNGLMVEKTITGLKTKYSYHRNGEIKQLIDGRNKFELRTGYQKGVAQTIADRDGRLTTRSVDNFGNITASTDPSNVVTTYQYNDVYKRLMKIDIDGLGNYYTNKIIANPQWTDSSKLWTYKMTRESVAGKYRKSIRYDVMGRVVFVHEQDLSSSPIANRIQRFKYDRLGRLAFVGNVRSDWSQSFGTHYQYDRLGRVISSRYPLSTSPAITYCYGPNCNGSTVGAVKDGFSVRDQEGYLTIYNYRAFGSPASKELVEIRQEIRPNSFSKVTDKVLITTIERNLVGFIKSVNQKGENSTGLTRYYTPYAMGGSTTHLVKSEQHPEFGNGTQKKTVDSYDQNGNATSVTNFNGAQTTYIYDPMDRLRYALNPAASGASATAPNSEFKYEANGALKEVIHGNQKWQYTYNEINRLKTEKLTIDNEVFEIVYEHDTMGHVKAVKYPGVVSSDRRTVLYDVSGFGQAKSVSGFANNVTYHPSGMLASIDFENGTVFTATPDSFQRPSTWKTQLPSGSGNNLFNFVYHYDDRSNISAIDNYFPAGGGSLHNLQYDGLNRLVRADGVWQIGQYSYDPLGNIDKKYVGGVNLNYTYNSSNLLQSVSSNSLGTVPNYTVQHDLNGNMTSSGFADYSFDQLNRLVASDTGGVLLANTYDGRNMRVKAITTRTYSNKPATTSTTYYVYNRAGQLLHELDSETGEERDHIQLNGRTIATIGKHNFADSDNDGMPDYFERRHGLRTDANDAQLDDDKDGRSNLVEYLYNHLPTDSDTDQDGIPDGKDIELPPFLPALEQKQGVDLTPVFEYLLN